MMAAAGGGAEPAVLACETCGLVSRNALAGDAVGLVQRCSRCGHTLRARKPFSIQRTWACVIAAAILYVPANVLPVMSTSTQFRQAEHTLIGGIRALWLDGSWGLSIIVFIASIAVPVLKIGVLGLLAWSVRSAPGWRRLDRARLYRLIESVGHWSMLDVYVVVVLAATIRFGPLASVGVGPGLLSFAAVVVLTMIATYTFDPRLIWDDEPAGRRAAPSPAAPPRGAATVGSVGAPP